MVVFGMGEGDGQRTRGGPGLGAGSVGGSGAFGLGIGRGACSAKSNKCLGFPWTETPLAVLWVCDPSGLGLR
jgi:hypothetical protein